MQLPTLSSEHFSTSPINSYKFLGVSLNPPASLRSRCLANIQPPNEMQKDVVLKMQYFPASSRQCSFSGPNSLPHRGLIQLHTQVLPKREKGQRYHYPISTWDSSCGEINPVRGSGKEALSKIWKGREKYKRKNLWEAFRRQEVPDTWRLSGREWEQGLAGMWENDGER